jgi:FkbM family methyltransferase
MLDITYKNLKYQFPEYYQCDYDWYKNAENDTKSFFMDVVQKNHNIIDAGAQIGMYSVLFSKLTDGYIFAFEPTDTVQKLIKNLEYNDCKNVEVINKPLANIDGTKKDKIFKLWSQNIIDEKDFEFVTIDSFVKSKNIAIDIIKIDVDSYDYEVLLGSRETLITQNPIVVVELNHALEKRGFKPSDGFSYMRDIGYEQIHFFDGDNYVFKKRKA